jgi:predicted Zn-dependent peptidase
MALFTSKEDESEEELREELRQLEEELDRGSITQAEFESRRLQLEARQAMLAVAPVQNANSSAQLEELDYLLEKKWISPEDYEVRRREILGETL